MSPFTRNYLIALLLEILVGAGETILDYWLPAAYFLRAGILSSIVSFINLMEAWKEGEGNLQPSWQQVLFLWWPLGTLVLWGASVSIGHFTGSNVPIGVSLLSPEPPPTVMPLPTYTPYPTPAPQVVIVTPTFTPPPTLAYGYQKVCTDAPPSPFAVGKEGYICNQDRILIRNRPSGRAKVTGSIEPGTRFIIRDGPECGDQRVWWKVQLYYGGGYHGMIGWMPESNPGGTERFLCPRAGD